MYFIYTIVMHLLVPFVLVRMIWLGRKDPACRERWQERFGHIPRGVNIPQRPIWIHAVSVGEVQVSRPLVAYLREHYPEVPILITTVTPTGAAAVARAYADDAAVSHSYFPYDLPFAINRFLRGVRPRVLLVLETEIWPTLYRQCGQAGIPILLLNARLSAQSMRGYRLLASLTRATLERAAVIAAQTGEDAERFIAIGAPAGRIAVTGNLKFDISLPRDVMEQGERIRRRLSAGRPIWIAASTHPGEELPVLEAMDRILRIVPDSLLIIAPRHPQRSDDVYDLCMKRGYHTARYTATDSCGPQTRVFLLDVLGQLPAHYAASDLAFVGGSLVPAGGHNMLEPASVGIPVLTGPHVFNFSEVARLLEANNALTRVEDAQQLAQKVIALMADGHLRDELGQRARQVVRGNHGGINGIAGLLQRYIGQQASGTGHEG